MFDHIEITSRQINTGEFRFDVMAVTHNGTRVTVASDPSYDSVILLTEGFGGDYGTVRDYVGTDRISQPSSSSWRAQLSARRVIERALETQ